MAMGTRKDRERQEMLWLSSTEIRAIAAHRFYQRLNELLDEHGFDRFVEGECKQFYADKMGRPSLSPGMYFRCCVALCVAIRLHLDESGVDNGPLCVVAGSHRKGRLSAEQIGSWNKETAVTCIVPKGGALVMRPLSSTRRRRVQFQNLGE